MVAPVYITWGTGMPRVPTAKAGVLELGHMNKRVIMFSSVTVFDCATHATPCIQALTQHDDLARACTISCSLALVFLPCRHARAHVVHMQTHICISELHSCCSCHCLRCPPLGTRGQPCFSNISAGFLKWGGVSLWGRSIALGGPVGGGAPTKLKRRLRGSPAGSTDLAWLKPLLPER